ncbi:hypothetical protein [Sporosarcina sp. Marseille-Q4943]|nr:hypothetical protein [Sporosarcina sp. Marseille-Q4943]
MKKVFSYILLTLIMFIGLSPTVFADDEDAPKPTSNPVEIEKL